LARLLPFPVAAEAEAVAAATDDSLPEVFRSFVVFRHDSIRRRASSLDSVSCIGNIFVLNFFFAKNLHFLWRLKM
jgi:hypothetical protein